MIMNKNMNDEIALVAYGLYEKRGQTHGNDFTDWVEAEVIVMKQYAKENERKVKDIKASKKAKAA